MNRTCHGRAGGWESLACCLHWVLTQVYYWGYVLVFLEVRASSVFQFLCLLSLLVLIAFFH